MNRLEELKKKAEDGTITDEEKEEMTKLEAEGGDKDDVVEEVEEEVEVPQETVDKIVKQAVDAVKAENKAKEKVVTKSVNISVKDKNDSLSKELRLVKFLQNLRNARSGAMLDLRVKASDQTMDSTTPGDVLIPPAEFVAEVQRLEENYGVGRQFATVRQTQRTSVLLNKKLTDVSIYEIGELAKKPATQMTFEQVELTLRKFAAIAPLSEELDEDSAINIWNELTNSFARAYAEQEDKLIFTDTTTGITKVSGTNLVTLDAAESFDDITFDDLNLMIYGVPTDSMKNGRFYFHRTILGVIQRIKDQNDNYILQPGTQGLANGTIWGYPYTLVEVLPSLAEAATSTGFMVFGDLKYTTLIERTQMKLKVLEEGTIDRGDGTDINLGEQDALALRAVKRYNNKVVFPSAFSVLKTNTTIS